MLIILFSDLFKVNFCSGCNNESDLIQNDSVLAMSNHILCEKTNSTSESEGVFTY